MLPTKLLSQLNPPHYSPWAGWLCFECLVYHHINKMWTNICTFVCTKMFMYICVCVNVCVADYGLIFIWAAGDHSTRPKPCAKPFENNFQSPPPPSSSSLNQSVLHLCFIFPQNFFHCALDSGGSGGGGGDSDGNGDRKSNRFFIFLSLCVIERERERERAKRKKA